MARVLGREGRREDILLGGEVRPLRARLGTCAGLALIIAAHGTCPSRYTSVNVPGCFMITCKSNTIIRNNKMHETIGSK